MKKFLSMFAFAAAIILGALSIASCGGDDDDDPVVKHKFSYLVTVDSKNTQTQDKPEFKEKKKMLEKEYMNKLAKFEDYDEEAVKIWNNEVEKLSDKALADVNDLYTQFEDDKVFIKIDFYRDDLPWKTMIWDVK